MASYETILVEQKGAVTLITLNRPQALNALNSTVLAELTAAFEAFDADEGQRCAVLTGSEKAFAAGADIKEMSDQGFASMYGSNFFQGWEKVTATRKPWLAAVAGYALGGGCEVAMMADFIIAADSAKFGQPEIKLGVTPGMGGSQRLTRAIGKAKAMEMCLTGRMMDAAEAERSGLVARVVPAADLFAEAMKAAEAIAGMAPLAAIATKEMINAAFETGLAQGINFERRLFHGLFGTEAPLVAETAEHGPPKGIAGLAGAHSDRGARALVHLRPLRAHELHDSARAAGARASETMVAASAARRMRPFRSSRRLPAPH